jgi:uncharacterized membrane protein
VIDRRERYRVTSWERVLFLVALLLLGLLVVETVLIALVSPDLARAIVSAVATEVVAGREGGIPVALTGGVPPLLAFQYSVSQDLAWAFLVYPLFLRFIHRYRDRPNVFARRLRRIEDSALEHEAYVERWGPLGVFLFMLLPFLVNGPLVGLVLGRLGGIRTRYLIVPVVAASVVASGAWTFLYDRMFALTDAFDPRLGRWIALGVVGVVLALSVIDVVRDRRKGSAD